MKAGTEYIGRTENEALFIERFRFLESELENVSSIDELKELREQVEAIKNIAMSGLDTYSPDIVSMVLGKCLELTHHINDIMLEAMNTEKRIGDIAQSVNNEIINQEENKNELSIKQLDFKIELPDFEKHMKRFRYRDGEGIVEGYAMMLKMNLMLSMGCSSLTHGYHLCYKIFSSAMSLNFQYHLMLYVYTNNENIKRQLANWVNYEIEKDLTNGYREPVHDEMEDFEESFRDFKNDHGHMKEDNKLYPMYKSICDYCNKVINRYLSKHSDYREKRRKFLNRK